MEFNTLEETFVETILNTFNESFSDYSIPFQLNLEQLKFKLHSENINLAISVGAFENDQLVGFILHGQNEINNSLYTYNGGTGVIPKQRGKKLTLKMYEYILPILVSKNVLSLQLEVISDNLPAIKSYQNAGFKLNRKLNCYKGEIKEIALATEITLKEINEPEWEKMKTFWEVAPAWQNSIDSIIRMDNSKSIVGAYNRNELVGYLAFNNSNNRILQIAVNKNHRRKGVASNLLQHLKNANSQSTSVINVDANDQAANAFFTNYGFENFLQQNEMILKP